MSRDHHPDFAGNDQGHSPRQRRRPHVTFNEGQRTLFEQDLSHTGRTESNLLVHAWKYWRTHSGEAGIKTQKSESQENKDGG